MSYFLLDNHMKKVRRKSHSQLGRWTLGLMQKPLHWRLRHHCFRWPWELWISMARQWLVVKRSLLTGAALGRSLTEVR